MLPPRSSDICVVTWQRSARRLLKGTEPIGELDEGSTLLKMNLHYPQLADWGPIARSARGTGVP